MYFSDKFYINVKYFLFQLTNSILLSINNSVSFHVLTDKIYNKKKSAKFFLKMKSISYFCILIVISGLTIKCCYGENVSVNFLAQQIIINHVYVVCIYI